MRLSELITRVRRKLADQRGIYWTDVEIAAELNHHQRALFRRKVEAHPSYGTRILDFSAIDNATQIEQLEPSEWLYHMPTWVYRVHKIWSRSGTQTIGELGQTSEGRAGWGWQSGHALSIKGNSAAQDLRLKVTKVPALMIRGTCAVQSPSLDTIVIPTTLPLEATPTGYKTVTQAFPVDLEEGALLGAKIEITSATISHDPRGVLAEVKAQSRDYYPAVGSYQHVLDVHPSYADFIYAGDTFESHAEIEDVHCGLLVLLTARSLFATTNNLAGVNVIAGELADEQLTFNNSLQPRGGPGYHIMQTEEQIDWRQDPERDPTFSG